MTTLSNGVEIPQLGFGTYKISPDDAYDAVRRALDAGYRHIDTAAMYGNEAEVGRAIAESGLDRAEVFVTSKLNNPFHDPDEARAAFARTLADLRLDQIDLYLIHWPMARTTDYRATWRTMVEFEDDGRARAVGVSNFQPEHLQAVIDDCGVTPRVNQIELHPYFPQRELASLHDEAGIVTASWSPLGRAQCLADPQIVALADELGRTPAQVIVRWHLQRGLVVIPKSTDPQRIVSNAQVFDFELDADQMARIDGLDRGRRIGSHPDEVEVGDR